MLKDTIAAAQRNDEESLLALIEKFKPLLKKYAYKLHYEDSFFDLQLDFIQIVTTLNLEAQTKESEGALVNYICNSVQHAYWIGLYPLRKLILLQMHRSLKRCRHHSVARRLISCLTQKKS